MRRPAHRVVIEEELIDLHVLERHHAALQRLGDVVAALAVDRELHGACSEQHLRCALRLALWQCRRTLDLVGRE